MKEKNKRPSGLARLWSALAGIAIFTLLLAACQPAPVPSPVPVEPTKPPPT